MKSNRSLFFLILFFNLTYTTVAYAAPPQSINYQAYLTDINGAPLTGTYNLYFRLYDSETGGNLFWTDSQNLTIEKGLLATMLGSEGNPLPKNAFNNHTWLGIEVNNDGEASPRVAMHNFNNAFFAEDADTLTGKTADYFQTRVVGSCPAGQFIRAVEETGKVVCEIDDNTTYDYSVFTPSGQSCGVGDVVTGFNTIGKPLCSSAVATNTNDIVNLNNDLNTHKTSTNPHNVTAAQAGALPSNVLTTHSSNPSIHHSRYSDAEAVAAILAGDGANSGIDADFLDGFSSSAFLRSDNSDVYTGDTLTFNSITILALNGTTAIGADSATDDDSVFFDDGSSQYFRWNETAQRFEFPGNLHLDGAFSVGPTNGLAFGYSQMRDTAAQTPVSGDISSSGDLYIKNDLEVGGEIYAHRILYMNGNNNPGQDADQGIYFYDNGARFDEFLKWNDLEARFDLSDNLQINGSLVSTSDTHAQSDLTVTGSLNTGYVYVQHAPTALTDTIPCLLDSSGTCYTTTFFLSCSGNKRIVNGGCSCQGVSPPNFAECYIIDNAQTGLNDWMCAAISPVSNATLSGFITCARVN